MHKYKLLAALLAALTLLCSGCNYKELDENIQDTIHQIEGEEDQTYMENPPMPEYQIKYKGIGETFSAYKQYAVDVGDGAALTEIEKGNEGLTYTLKIVTFYFRKLCVRTHMCHALQDISAKIGETSCILDGVVNKGVI